MATEILNTISKDEHAIAKYRARRKWEADLTTNLSVSRRLGKEEGRQEGILIGRQEGMQKGMERGRQKRENEIIEKLKQSGMPYNEIQRILNM